VDLPKTGMKSEAPFPIGLLYGSVRSSPNSAVLVANAFLTLFTLLCSRLAPEGHT